MKTIVATFALLALFSGSALKASEPEDAPRGVATDFAVRDAKAASRKAEDFYTAHSSEWAKTARPFRAESTTFARSPIDAGAGLKRGDPIWIVVVVNDAQSTLIQIPVGIVWVRAKDGSVWEIKWKEANQALEPTSTAVTPPAVAGDRASGTRGSS